MSIGCLGLLENINLQNVELSGNLTLTNLQSTQSLATNADGQIVAGTGGGSNIQQWALPAGLFTDLTFGDTSIGSNSYAIIDNNARVVNIFLNLIVIPPSPVASKVPQFSIDINQNFFTNPSSQSGTLPPPSSLFRSYAENLGTSTFFFNDISLCNTTPTPNVFINSNYYFSAYFAGSGLMNISSIGAVSVSSNQRLVYSGTMQYMF
jgi:hypothetical protein